MAERPDILGSIDYRKWLSETSEHLKVHTRHFSHRWFAQAAGIGNPSFYSQVVAGKRNLTPAMAERFAQVLGLSEKETLYFRHLVAFDQAATSLEKQEHYAVLREMNGSVRQRKVASDAWDFYRHWWVPALRELVALRGRIPGWAELAAQLQPPITARQAKAAVGKLQELGLLEVSPEGVWRQTDRALTSGEDVVAQAVRSHNRQMADLGAQSIERFSPAERHVSGITVGLSRAGFQMLAAEILAFKDRVVRLVDHDEGPGEVYQFNVQLFPLSREVDP